MLNSQWVFWEIIEPSIIPMKVYIINRNSMHLIKVFTSNLFLFLLKQGFVMFFTKPRPGANRVKIDSIGLIFN